MTKRMEMHTGSVNALREFLTDGRLESLIARSDAGATDREELEGLRLDALAAIEDLDERFVERVEATMGGFSVKSTKDGLIASTAFAFDARVVNGTGLLNRVGTRVVIEIHDEPELQLPLVAQEPTPAADEWQRASGGDITPELPPHTTVECNGKTYIVTTDPARMLEVLRPDPDTYTTPIVGVRDFLDREGGALTDAGAAILGVCRDCGELLPADALAVVHATRDECEQARRANSLRPLVGAEA